MPEESPAAFKVPEGFRVAVAASQTLIAPPAAVCWDERGLMFVGELHDYNVVVRNESGAEGGLFSAVYEAEKRSESNGKRNLITW